MLKRIKKIENIGRFVNYKNGKNGDFKKETVIFGLNTYGKSTITAILRSLQTGNNDILVGRKTFGAMTGKNVEIDFEEEGTNDKYVFQSRVWNKINPNILIFDSKFIAENVFDGENITFDQQKNLNTVIIGKKGRDLNNEIIALQKQSDEFANQKGEKTREFNQHFPGFNFENFRTLSEDISIDDTIKDKDREIKFEREKEDIKKAIKIHIQNVSGFRFSIRDILVKTLDVKQEEIETHIKSHFSTDKSARNFIGDGLDFLKQAPFDGSLRACVFCGQELGAKAESLIAIYSAYFKGGYEQLQNEVNKTIDYFKGINFESTLEKIAADLRAKDLDIGLNDHDIAKISELKKQFEKELDKKRDLNYVIDFATFDDLKTGIEKIKANLEELEQKKLNIPSPKSVIDLEKEKQMLEIIKKRHTPAWIKFCKDLDAIETEAQKIRATREIKRGELDTYSSDIFNTHKVAINKFCADMCADFEIDDVKPLKKIIGRDERIFTIKFFSNYKVNIDNENDKTANFRNTLSESDKRLLAFAFFASLLAHDRELDKKIVVFDDPFSSFDSERRRQTVHLITDIACKYKRTDGTEENISPKQKIILTHEDRFAKKLIYLMPDACSLKIQEYVVDGQKRSKIVHTDFAQDFPDDDISHRIEKIKEIFDTRTFATEFEKDCREILEHIFKCKYCLELKDEISSKKSVRSFVIKLKGKCINNFENEDKFKKFDRLCDYLNIELHDNGSLISSGDKESIIKDFFDCLKLA